jgi:hypothetical protein
MQPFSITISCSFVTNCKPSFLHKKNEDQESKMVEQLYSRESTAILQLTLRHESFEIKRKKRTRVSNVRKRDISRHHDVFFAPRKITSFSFQRQIRSSRVCNTETFYYSISK